MGTLRIALIEDNRLTKTMSEQLLRQAGYNVCTAEDGAEGLKLVQSVLPDVVLLDVLLPKLSGEEVLLTLKHNPATAHVPVVIITGLSHSYEEHFRHEGVFAFLNKAQLLDGIEPLLEVLRQIESSNHPRQAIASPADSRFAASLQAKAVQVGHIPS